MQKKSLPKEAQSHQQLSRFAFDTGDGLFSGCSCPVALFTDVVAESKKCGRPIQGQLGFFCTNRRPIQVMHLDA